MTSSLQGGEGEYIFLKTLKPVDISGARQRDGMLAAGNYEYEIQFPFPSEVDLLEMAPETVKGKAPRLPNTPQAVFSSPQTTRDRLATIDYDFSVIVEHGKLFKRSAKWVALFTKEKGVYALIGSELAFCTSPALSRIPRLSFARSPTEIASGPQTLRVTLLDGFLSLPWSLEATLRAKKRSSNTRCVYFLYLPFIFTDLCGRRYSLPIL